MKITSTVTRDQMDVDGVLIAKVVDTIEVDSGTDDAELVERITRTGPFVELVHPEGT